MNDSALGGLSSLRAKTAAPNRGDSGVSYSVTNTPVDEGEIHGVCNAGFDVARLDTMAEPANGQHAATKALQRKVNLPSEFTIGAYRGQPYGAFWVPGNMPATHNAHIVEYTVQVSDFHLAQNDAHFVNVVTAASDTDFGKDFDGKGMVFGYFAGLCGSSFFGSIGETWKINSTPNNKAVLYTGANTFNANGSRRTSAPNTCSPMNANTTYRFLVGANRQQASVYYRYPAASATAEYVSPVITDVVSGFRSGSAGVAFFVGGSANPLFIENWYLAFSRVTQRTQP